MNGLDPAQLHPDVGSYGLTYWHHAGNGNWQRRLFHIKAGENPDWWKAKMLMPGAECDGSVTAAVFEVESCCPDPENDPAHKVCVRVGSSVFKAILYAKTKSELKEACASIGGIRPMCEPKLPLLICAGLVLRYFWERRLQIKRRSPMDRF